MSFSIRFACGGESEFVADAQHDLVGVLVDFGAERSFGIAVGCIGHECALAVFVDVGSVGIEAFVVPAETAGDVGSRVVERI